MKSRIKVRKEGAVKLPPSQFIDMFNRNRNGEHTERGRFYCEYEGIFVAGYNNDGYLWLEDFENEIMALAWLNDENMTSEEAIMIDEFISSHIVA